MCSHLVKTSRIVPICVVCFVLVLSLSGNAHRNTKNDMHCKVDFLTLTLLGSFPTRSAFVGLVEELSLSPQNGRQCRQSQPRGGLECVGVCVSWLYLVCLG